MQVYVEKLYTREPPHLGETLHGRGREEGANERAKVFFALKERRTSSLYRGKEAAIGPRRQP
jgi:hypothetical protein